MSEEQQIRLKEMIEWRRYLHQHPELSYKEYKTSCWLQEKIKNFGDFSIQLIGKTSFIATIEGEATGSKEVIAFRTDMDALPVQEETDLEFASVTPGVMHACGHDTHMAMLLGLAKYLGENKLAFSNKVKLICQSAEEIPPGGAIEIVKSGFLDDVSHIYGLHVFTGFPIGHIGIASGAITASQDIIELEIEGKGSHGATPELGIDPILVGSEIVNSVHHIVSRNISAFESAVISFGQFTSGDVFNIIPDRATLKGNVRTTNNQTRQLIKERVTQVISGICSANNANFKLDYTAGYSPVYNNEETTAIALSAVTKCLGESLVFEDPQQMVSEDFSEYSNRFPSCFMIVGGGLEKNGYPYMNHHPKFDIDETAMSNGLDVYLSLIKEHKNR